MSIGKIAPHLKLRLLRLAVSAALLAATAFLFACSRSDNKPSGPPEKVTISVTPWPASAAIYVAHDKGFFRDEGLDAALRSYVSGHLGLDAALSGKSDLAAAGDTPIARAAVEGRKPAVVATVCRIEEAIMIIARKDRGIAKPFDLRGKRIGLVPGTTADFFLHIYLTTSFIDPKDVRIVELATEKVVEALLSGEVDAVSTWAPHTIVLRERLGDNALVIREPGIYTMTWNIAASREFVKSRPAAVRKFLRGVIRANGFIREHPDEARDIAGRHIGVESALYRNEWKDYDFIATLDQGLLLNLEDQARWMIRSEEGGRKMPDFMDILYSKGLKSVTPD